MTRRLPHGLATVTALMIVTALGVSAAPARAAFPGANGKIAFRSTRDNNYEVWAMNADGSGQANLTRNAAADTEPAFSPDGSRIVFQSNGEVYVMQADGSGQTNLTKSPTIDMQPAFSPDGSKLAFYSDRNGDSEIWVMGADGSAPTNLTRTPGPDSDPAFSPDGSKIAFVSGRDRSNLEVYVMNADGTAQTNLTASAAGDDEAPDWAAVITVAPGVVPPPGAPGIFPSLCPAGTSPSVRCYIDPQGRLAMVGTPLGERLVGTSGANRISPFGGDDTVTAPPEATAWLEAANGEGDGRSATRVAAQMRLEQLRPRA